MNDLHLFTDVNVHHLVPKREGRLGNEPTYVQACACGASYRNGFMYPPPGYPGVPYDREAAIERAIHERDESSERLADWARDRLDRRAR